MQRHRFVALAAVALAAATASSATPPASAPTNAAADVLYRCTSPAGAVALQDAPCPPGHREERREIARFAAPPEAVPTRAPIDASAAPTADASPDEAPAADTPPRILPGEPTPSRPLFMPPPLWRCTDLNGANRWAETFDPRPRCVPLSVLGVDLSRAPPSAATLCRTVEDRCVELGGDAACAAWKERLDEAESALRHAFSDTQAERRRERDRAKAIVEGDCRP